jgi:hypothetical protein
LRKSWYLECASMDQKRTVIGQLRLIEYSPSFVSAVESFVENKSVLPHFPTEKEQDEIVANILAREQRRNA